MSFVLWVTQEQPVFAQSAAISTEPAVIISPASSKAVAVKKESKLSKMGDTINEYLANLQPQEEWNALISQLGPSYGNYCSPAQSDPTFEQPCISQLDCMCKEHSFGYSLRKHRDADRQFAEEVFGRSFRENKNNADYEGFLKLMTASLFAGQLSGKDLFNQILAEHNEYSKQPQKAKDALDKLIDENEVFRKKIDEIGLEKQTVQESQAKRLPAEPRSMALQIQPFNILLGLVTLQYEWKAQTWVSIRGGLSFLGAGLITETYLSYGNNKDFSIFGIFGPKFYVVGEVLKNGIYLEPRVDAGYENVIDRASLQKNRVQAFAVVPALLIGFDKVFSPGIHVDVGIGFGYYLSTLEPRPDYNTRFFVPKFQASIGYAW